MPRHNKSIFLPCNYITPRIRLREVIIYSFTKVRTEESDELYRETADISYACNVSNSQQVSELAYICNDATMQCMPMRSVEQTHKIWRTFILHESYDKSNLFYVLFIHCTTGVFTHCMMYRTRLWLTIEYMTFRGNLI